MRQQAHRVEPEPPMTFLDVVSAVAVALIIIAALWVFLVLIA